MNRRSAIAAIERSGILLVYPIENQKEPPSLWSSFYPRSEMRWEWDQKGDDRVSDLWHLREELSRSGKVVYAKWYRGRATFFSKDIFTALLAVLGSSRARSLEATGIGPTAYQVLSLLDLDSPLSTKQIKSATDLRGRALESTYERALKELWVRLLVVGYGEVDEGAFPSLAVGSTRLLFEDLWNGSRELSPREGREVLLRRLPAASPFLKQLTRIERGLDLLSADSR